MWCDPGKSRSLGFIPTGWYPTSVRVTPDGNLAGGECKGTAPKSNRHAAAGHARAGAFTE